MLESGLGKKPIYLEYDSDLHNRLYLGCLNLIKQTCLYVSYHETI